MKGVSGSLESYTYDSNGNQVTRVSPSSVTTTLTYDAENHLISASGNGDSAAYVYDGDGKMVKATVNGRTTTYIGDYYEWESKPNQPVFPNPGFEAEGNWWMHREFPATSNYMVKGNEKTPYEGDGSASISNLAYGDLYSPTLPIGGGQSYTVRAYIKGEIDADSSSGCVTIQVHFYSGETYLETQKPLNCQGTITTTWQQLGGAVTAPAGANGMKVSLLNDRISGWVAFDDVTVIDSSGANIMVNGGFETATDWATYQRSEFPATGFARFGSGAHGGTYFYMIHNLTAGSIYTASANRVTVAAGEQYDVYAYARGEMDPDDSYSAVYCWYIRVRFYNSSGTQMSGNYIDAAQGCPGSLTTSWQNLGSRVTIPTGAVKMDVQLATSYSSGWVAYDDVQIYKVVGGVRTGSNLAVNPSFESATGGWSVALPAAAPASSVWRCNFGTAAGRNGGYAYSISNHMYGHPVSSKMPVNPGTQYRLSAFLKGKIDAEDSDGAILLRAYFYDSNGNYILDYDVVNTATVAANWTEYAGTFTVPITATQVEIHVIAYCMTAQLQVDNFSVTMVNPTYTTLSRKYYYAGGERVAMNAPDTGLAWILSDHLGSTSKVIRASDYATISETRYKPFGQPRYVNGVSPTQHGFTGQIDEPDLGIVFFQSRFYDPYLNRFLSPDDIIPDQYDPQSWDRYSYCQNNPVNYTDPSGHMQIKDEDTRTKNVEILSDKGKEIYELYDNWKDVYGDLSENEFFGWMMAYEMNGMQDVEFSLDGKSVTVLEIMKEVVARQLFGDALKAGGHMPYCYSKTCTAGLFNFLANYVQVARDRSKQSSLSPLDYPSGYQQTDPLKMLHDKLLTDSANFTNDVLNASPASKTYGDDLPYHWGNAAWGVGRDYGTTNSTGLVYMNGTFLIYTANQGPKK